MKVSPRTLIRIVIVIAAIVLGFIATGLFSGSGPDSGIGYILVAFFIAPILLLFMSVEQHMGGKTNNKPMPKSRLPIILFGLLALLLLAAWLTGQL